MKDDKEVIRYFQQAAGNNDANAQFELGSLYILGGGGLQRDSEEGTRLLQVAARQGHVQAQSLLRSFRESGAPSNPIARWLYLQRRPW
jgi:TPR repeat protein